MDPFFSSFHISFFIFLWLFLKTCSYLITLLYMLNASSLKRKTHSHQFDNYTSSLKNSFLFNNYIFSLSKNMLAVSFHISKINVEHFLVVVETLWIKVSTKSSARWIGQGRSAPPTPHTADQANLLWIWHLRFVFIFIF